MLYRKPLKGLLRIKQTSAAAIELVDQTSWETTNVCFLAAVPACPAFVCVFKDLVIFSN